MHEYHIQTNINHLLTQPLWFIFFLMACFSRKVKVLSFCLMCGTYSTFSMLNPMNFEITCLGGPHSSFLVSISSHDFFIYEINRRSYELFNLHFLKYLSNASWSTTFLAYPAWLLLDFIHLFSSLPLLYQYLFRHFRLRYPQQVHPLRLSILFLLFLISSRIEEGHDSSLGFKKQQLCTFKVAKEVLLR